MGIFNIRGVGGVAYSGERMNLSGARVPPSGKAKTHTTSAENATCSTS